jgi:hypothetical protein
LGRFACLLKGFAHSQYQGRPKAILHQWLHFGQCFPLR